MWIRWIRIRIRIRNTDCNRGSSIFFLKISYFFLKVCSEMAKWPEDRDLHENLHNINAVLRIRDVIPDPTFLYAGSASKNLVF